MATTVLLVALIRVAAALLVAVTAVGAPVSLATRGPWRPTRMAAFLLLYLLKDLGIRQAAASPAQPLQAGRTAPAGRPTPSRCSPGCCPCCAGLRSGCSTWRSRPPRPRPHPPRAGRCWFLVRHAGLGDSFLLLQILLTEAGSLPHTVLKGAARRLRLDVLLGRVPHCFLPPAQGTAQDAIAERPRGACCRGTRW